jgi:N-acetylglutamate synthase-like GNAT family acetyltransferase
VQVDEGFRGVLHRQALGVADPVGSLLGAGPSSLQHVPLDIRSATAEDQPTIRRFVRNARLNPMSLNWPNFVVAEEDGAVVGVGQVKAHGDGSRELASIVVAPERQGQGIGSTVIKTLLASNSDAVLHLTCRRELQGYYERFGFRRLNRAEYPPYFGRLIPLVNLIGRLNAMEILVMRREASP